MPDPFAWHPEPELIGFRDPARARHALESLGEALWHASLDWLYDEAMKRPVAPESYPEMRERFFGPSNEPAPAPRAIATSKDLLREFRERIAPYAFNAHHPGAFVTKERWSMEWYYPVLGGAMRGSSALARIDERWDDFVVPGLGIRCVDDRPWVTGAETCELVLALEAIGERERAHEQFTAMHHLREDDGSYWTGLVYADGKRWPVERTTWTGAAVILAADALSSTTPGCGIFRGADLPRGLEGEYDCECATSER